MHRLAPEQKRLQTLKRQLYGKDEGDIKTKPLYDLKDSKIFSSAKSPTGLETNYLRHDLTKIFILSTVIIAIQLTIYFGKFSDKLLAYF